MTRLTENKIVVVTRKTRLEELIVRFNTPDQARFYVEHSGADFEDYQAEHWQYQVSLNLIERQLESLGRVQVLERAYVPNFVFGPADTVVVVGQDGLVANVIKYLDEQPLIAFNPDPRRWDGPLLPFAPEEAGRVIKEVFKNKRPIKEITLAQARLGDGQTLCAVNDLFIGPKSHTSARYVLESGSMIEVQSSSGLIVSTGLGSTGWLRSVIAGARGIGRLWPSLTGSAAPATIPAELNGCFPWSADYLYFSVREPFPSRTTGADLVMGRVDEHNRLTVTSLMAVGGVIFSDGIESDFLDFNSGQKAEISVAGKKGRLVI